LKLLVPGDQCFTFNNSSPSLLLWSYIFAALCVNPVSWSRLDEIRGLFGIITTNLA